jgi:hypothetical protein
VRAAPRIDGCIGVALLRTAAGIVAGAWRTDRRWNPDIRART